MSYLDDLVQRSVTKAIASPSYSVLLEEVTRNERQVVASRLQSERLHRGDGAHKTSVNWWGFWRGAADNDRTADPCMVAWPTSSNEDVRLSNLLFSPAQMKRRAEARATNAASGVVKAVLIGGTGYFGKFIAEELKNKQMDVVVVARNVDKANRIFQPIFDGTAERRRRESMGYVVKASPSSSGVTADAGGPNGDMSVPKLPQVTCVQVDMTQQADLSAVQSALHGASLVFYLASAKNAALSCPNSVRAVDLEGLKTCIRACDAVDAHLVVVSPLFAWQSRWRPVYLYYNYLASKRGYLRIARERERLFFNDDGSPGAYVSEHAPTLRFSLFRVNHLVFPSFQTHSVVAKNNCIDDLFQFVDVAAIGGKGFLTGGDLCARYFARFLTRSLCFHRSCINARIDVCGAVRNKIGLVDINDTRALDAALQGFRHEG